MIVQHFRLNGTHPDGLWSCAGCAAVLESCTAGVTMTHADDCTEMRVGEWRGRLEFAWQMLDEAGLTIISQRTRLRELGAGPED